MSSTDVLTRSQRKRCMSAVRNKDTKPEMIVRRLVHSLGYRFRLHDKKLPGTPDLVFSSRRKVIFVHGCFWHRHSCKKGRSNPKNNAEFWAKKLNDNRKRDVRHRKLLRKDGWSILVIWECQIHPSKHDHLVERIESFLDG